MGAGPRGVDSRAEALGGVSTVDIVELLFAHGAESADSDVWEVVDRLALPWTLGLAGGHGKNTSLLLSGTRARLAPLYDVASMLPYVAGGEDIFLAMLVGDEPSVARIGRAAWEQHARRLRLAPGEVLESVERIATAPAARAAAESCTSTGAGDFAERFAAAAAPPRQRPRPHLPGLTGPPVGGPDWSPHRALADGVSPGPPVASPGWGSTSRSIARWGVCPGPSCRRGTCRVSLASRPRSPSWRR